MLEIKNIKKQYVTGDLTQDALNNVSLTFRDNEFVAILGPSGSGKTTMLNIIGGLDRYDDGDLIINGISTKKYKDSDWDSYRNHTIGFVFQSYNLIPHQTVLSNVELALTISGVSKTERRKRAIEALEKVGLGNQLHKKPNQMSGGQMQRVAIARALVNNPSILLADEPTGALDSDTSVQVMELLKEVANDRLVIMVTHNPELAEEYATRIVTLKDGIIKDDTGPFNPDTTGEKAPEHKNMGKSSMSISTALSLSFNNLKTKKARTLLTSFAGSIGIIGIAMILALSNGVNQYIEDTQKKAMSSYPIEIESKSLDMSSIIADHMGTISDEVNHELDGIYSNTESLSSISDMSTSIKENNLAGFKEYLDDKNNEIHNYIGENGIIYSYNTKFDIFSYDKNGELINTDGSTFKDKKENDPYASIMSGDFSSMLTASEMQYFNELVPKTDGTGVNETVKESFELIYGEYPDAYNELLFTINGNNEIDATVLYSLGILPAEDYKEILKNIKNGEEIKVNAEKIEYSDLCNKSFYLIPQCDYYIKDGDIFKFIEDTTSKEFEEILNNAIELKITGIVRIPKSEEMAVVTAPVGYTKALTDYIIEHTNNSDVVKAQEANKDKNVLTGFSFEAKDDAAKIEMAKEYILNMSPEEQMMMFQQYNPIGQTPTEIPTNVPTEMSTGFPVNIPNEMIGIEQMTPQMSTEEMINTMPDEVLLMVFDMFISEGSYDENMTTFGKIDVTKPSSITIYADSFSAKEKIADCIEDYNKTVDEENAIEYVDYVALLMSSVTTIVDTISYVLIAFVSVSLVVSSIMIGIITYISVLERTKEIGVLRAIGASKRNISQVFNAETFIIGLCSGCLGIGISLLLLIPSNMIIHAVTASNDINAVLPADNAITLIVLSVILTLIGGLVPAKKAAKKDPVLALRTE